MIDEKKESSLVKNTADPKQVRNASKVVKRMREQELNDILSVLSTKEGRRFMYRLVNEICHYDSDDFNNSGSITFRSLGERNIGRIIKGDSIEASHDLWQKSEKENWLFLQTQGEK